MVAGASSRPWTELLRRTAYATVNDGCLGLAAQLSYYLCLALFPTLLLLVAISSFFSLDMLTDDVAGAIGPFLTSELLSLIQDQMRRLGQAHDGGMVTVGVLGALWGSSAAVVAMVSAVNRACNLPETRPWWRVRLIAAWLTFVLGALAIAAVALVMAGPAMTRLLGIAESNVAWWWMWNLARWPAAFGLVTVGIGLIFHYAPDADHDWRWVTPGAVVGTLIWLCASLAFKFYIATFTDYEGSYGAVGGIVILLLWLYLSALGILIGAEFNAALEPTVPHGDEAITDASSGRRVIGARAVRMFEQLRPSLRPIVDPVDAGGSNGWAALMGLVFASAVMAARGPRRVLRGRS